MTGDVTAFPGVLRERPERQRREYGQDAGDVADDRGRAVDFLVPDELHVAVHIEHIRAAGNGNGVR